MYKIEITATCLNDLKMKLLILTEQLHVEAGIVEKGVNNEKESSKKTSRKRKEEVISSVSKSDSSEAKLVKVDFSEEPKVDVEIDISSIDVRGAFMNFVMEHGHQKALSILNEFGVSKFSELPEIKHKELLQLIGFKL